MEERSGDRGVSLLIPRASSLGQQTAPGSPVRTLGIDLGTTNSTVAELSWPGNGRPLALEDLRCLEIAQPTDVGEYTHILVPSVVALAKGVNGTKGGLQVGEGAKRLRARTVELGLEQNRNISTPSTPASSSAAAA
jgi:molecular chaperone DnaK (HSP70)